MKKCPDTHERPRESFADIMAVVNDILKHGNDAIIRKKQGGYIVMEDKKTIKYST